MFSGISLTLNSGRPYTTNLLLALLALDLCIIGAYIGFGFNALVMTGEDIPPLWNLAEEFSAAELLGYVKWLALAICLVWAYIRCGENIFLSFGGVFILILLDDSLQLHERGGALLVQTFELPSIFGVRGQDIGELGVWAMLGGLALGLLAWGYNSSSSATRPFAYYFLAVLTVLVVAGIGLDLLNAHEMFRREGLAMNIIAGLVTIAEDGTELIVASFGTVGAVAAVFWAKSYYRLQFGGSFETRPYR